MYAEWPLLLVWPLLAAFIALPAAGAWWRRRCSREVSAVALELAVFAAATRKSEGRHLLDDTLRLRVIRLRLPDASMLHLAEELEQLCPAALADAAQRLALRMRRRVAFERKMLARSAPGLRRGAIAASIPPLLVLLLSMVGMEIPVTAQVVLILVEASGCALLWRLARVEI
jgi:hypothetical protein